VASVSPPSPAMSEVPDTSLLVSVLTVSTGMGVPESLSVWPGSMT